MKTLLLIAILSISAYAQCVSSESDPCVPVRQSVLDRAAKALDEIPKLRDLVEKQASVIKLSEAERTAAKELVDALNAALEVRAKMIADYENLIAKMSVAYDKVIAMQQALLDRLTADLNRPKSAWKKFVQGVREIGLILAGVSLGRIL